MDNDLRSALEKDEKILWEGSPEPFVTLDKTNKIAFIRKTVITVLVCLALILTYSLGTIPLENFKIGVVLIIMFFGALIISSVFMDARKIRKQRFAITNQRLIRQGDELRSISLSKIKKYLFSMDEDGHTSLLIGDDAVKKKSSKWRTMGASTIFINDETGECEQAVFYAIAKPDSFKKVFEEQMKK